MDSRDQFVVAILVALVLSTPMVLMVNESDGAPKIINYYDLDANGESTYIQIEGSSTLSRYPGDYSKDHAFMGWRDRSSGILYPIGTDVSSMNDHSFDAVYEERPSTILEPYPWKPNEGWTIDCRSGDVIMFYHATGVEYTFDDGLIDNLWADGNGYWFHTMYAPEPGTYHIELIYGGPVQGFIEYGGQIYGAIDVITINVSEANYNVSFSSEGSVIHTETVEPNATVQSYTPPAREGYTFGGWYTDTSFQNLFNFDTPITSDITLYAKWIESPVTITFYVEGQMHSTLQVPKGSVGVVYTPIMVTGVFAGWFYDAGFTQKYDATVALTGDINLYAMGVPPLIFTSEPNAAANIQQVSSYGMFFFDATDSSGRYQIHWDFGDGNTSSDAIAYNTYSAPGVYTVTLKVTNIYGESSTTTYDVIYRDPANGGGENDLRYIVIALVCILGGGLVIRRVL